MRELSKRSTVYFDPKLHRALRMKATVEHCSVSELVNDAVALLMSKDQEDIAAVQQRCSEPTVTYEALLDDLKKHGKI
jgi:hypothetical protein